MCAKYGCWDLKEECTIKSDKELLEVLYGNIVMVGGSSVYPGMSERLKEEMELLTPHNETVKVIAPPMDRWEYRKYSEWIGESILASLYNFQTRWITRKEYDEHGISIVHRKCCY